MAVFKLLGRTENAFLSVFPTKWWSVKFKSDSKSWNIQDILDCPEKPKRPKSSFFKFVSNKRNDHSTSQSGEKIRTLSIEWKNLNEKEKEKYIKEYHKEIEEYKEKMEAYQNSLTETQKEDLKRLKQEIKKAKALGVSTYSKKELSHVLQKPKKPMSPFLRFRKDSGKTDLLELAQEWKNLSKSQKDKYLQEAEKEMEVYLEDLKDWELKMIKEGKVNVVRFKTLSKIL